MMDRIYMDNAATTRVSSSVWEAMRPYFCEIYGNPMSVHGFGREARKAVEKARRQVAAALHAQPGEIYFTGCGTESDNWAIRGAAYANRNKGRHLITTSIEHHAVLHTCEQLENEGFEVSYVPVDEYGVIRMDALEGAIRPDTTLISVMAANNEIGTIQPIEEIAKLARSKGILFHTDAVQAIGSIPFDVEAMNIDLLSLSGHKFHAPKGVGALYMRNGTKVQRLLNGGAQERSQRAGTENVASIVGLGKAIEQVTLDIPGRCAGIAAVRDHLQTRILREVPYTKLNGHPTKRLPGSLNVSFRFIEGESLLMSLDAKGIAASAGSACTAGSLDPSHVLRSIGLDGEMARGALRLSLSDENTMEEADRTADAIRAIAARLRSMSPMYDQFLRESSGGV